MKLEIKLLQKGLTAVLAAISLGVIIAVLSYIPPSQRVPNVADFHFFEYLILYSLFSLPVFLVGGVPYSLLIDFIVSKTKMKYTYFANLLFYTIGGVLVNYWFWTAFFDPHGYGIDWGLARGMAILGIGSSLLFLHLSYLSKKIIFEGRFLR